MNDNFNITKELLGYTERKNTSEETYKSLGMKCGLEVHQQLKTDKKLFCNCPAGLYQRDDEYDAEILRHMRPTLSEMGGYDGTALMEFKTRKNIFYRISNKNTCTYDIDDTPPFKLNRQALDIALEISLLLKSNIVGELHITRKQYLDGSIPAGFQRTGIVSIEGSIPLKNKDVGIIQLSIEEDSCREVSDIGHQRVYTTDRLGMPLIETVTYPHMETPDEAAEACAYIRFLNRSTEKVRTGIGAAREDVNVSIIGGTRVEIKGVSKISLIPELVHNETFRQKSLLQIKEKLSSRFQSPETWKLNYIYLGRDSFSTLHSLAENTKGENLKIVAVNLPHFKNILSYFTSPGRMFSDEISDRLKVISCIEKPNLIHSEEIHSQKVHEHFEQLAYLFNATEDDAQLVFWGPQDDIATALDTIRERCQMAFAGVPNETRKPLNDGTTLFERVLPGADRMYPDTDSAPIKISKSRIKELSNTLPSSIDKNVELLKSWGIPTDCFTYILRNNLTGLIQKISHDFNHSEVFVSTLLAHKLKHLEGVNITADFDYNRIYDMFRFINKENLDKEILFYILPILYKNPELNFHSILDTLHFSKHERGSILKYIPGLKEEFKMINKTKNPNAWFKWIMKELRPIAVGNISLRELSSIVLKGGDNNE